MTMVLIGCITVLLAVVAFVVIGYFQATQPIEQAKKEAISLAESYGKVEKVEHFYRYAREQTFYAVFGQTKQKQAVIVLIPQSGKDIQVMSQSDGLSEKAARAVVAKEAPNETIKRISFGLTGDQKVWEVTTKTTHGDWQYYLVDFKDGKIVKTIKNM